MVENRANFPAMPTGTQVQSVVEEHISSGHAETTFRLTLQQCWLHQLPPNVETGSCVLGAGFLAGMSGCSQRRGQLLILPCPQLLSLSLFLSAFFLLFPRNYNSKWLRHGPFTVIISLFLLFCSLFSLSL